MPAVNFPEYAQIITGILNALLAIGQAKFVNVQVDQRSAVRGFISGVVQFSNDSELHVREFVDTTLVEPRLMYAYHYQDERKVMIFRYDNAAHRPPLS